MDPLARSCRAMIGAPPPDGAYGDGHRNVLIDPPWAGFLVSTRSTTGSLCGGATGRRWTELSVGCVMLGLVDLVFDAELWIWDARRADSWTFVSLPEDVSQEIRDLAGDGPRRGFGSVRVRVTVGGSTWKTSIFPDAGRGCYVLPVKRAVREAEGLDTGDVATVTVKLIDS